MSQLTLDHEANRVSIEFYRNVKTLAENKNYEDLSVLISNGRLPSELADWSLERIIGYCEGIISTLNYKF